MSLITKIKAQKSNPKRANIHLDGSYSFSITLDAIVSNGLKKGQQLCKSEVKTLIIESEKEKVLAKVLNFLSYRPRSQREITNRMKKYTSHLELHKSTIEKEITNYLINHDLINDLSFAKWFITQRMRHRPRSQRRLMSELYAKGISNEIAVQAIQDSAFDELNELQKVLKKKLKNQKLRPANKQKIINYLLRQGFSYHDITQSLQGPSLQTLR